jgi:two-component system, sporulation sensor kinase B
MTKQLLLNLSLLFVLLFILQIHIDRRNIRELPRHLTMYYFMFSILMCILLTIKVNEDLYFDLRQVPLVVGTLYLGTGFQLLFVALLVRSMLGIDLGFWISSTIFIIFTLISWRIHPWFLKQKQHQRLLVSVISTMGLSILIIGASSIFFDVFRQMETWIAFMLIPSVTTLIMAYTIDTITRNLHFREQVERTKKMEAVTHMAAAISHEIRNPLTSAKGFVQFVSEDASIDQRQKEYLSIALQELQQAEAVIRDYLTFARPAIDSAEDVDISQELGKTLKILQPLANLNSVEICTDLRSAATITGDRHKFHQCFFNIIKNCIEAMPSGGTLSVCTVDTASRIVITILDTGCGTTEQQLQRLGEPYYSTKEGKGTGLGMMVVYSIIKAMNGTISVESQVKKGTAFSITFPVKMQQ